MLKQRVLTALVMSLILVLAVLKLPTLYFAMFMTVVIALGAWEWAKLSGYKNPATRIVYAALIACLCGFLYRYADVALKQQIVLLSVVCWLFGFACIIAYQKGFSSLPRQPFIRAFMGVLVMIPAWLSVIMLHSLQGKGLRLILFLFVLIWVADSAAYFAGRRWGKNRLANRVSPGKSWEGAIAAIVASLLVGFGYAIWQEMDAYRILSFSVLSIIIVICSIMGDLFESLVKRTANIKDSGTLLPGHGGIMDRIDSLTAASPIFFMGLLWLGEIS